MKRLLIAALAAAALLAPPAFADRAHLSLGFSFGVPLYWGPPVYYYPPPYYYYPPPVVYAPSPVISAPPPTMVERPVQPEVAYWYYCASERGYYPYVRECPGGWERVPAAPPPAPGR